MSLITPPRSRSPSIEVDVCTDENRCHDLDDFHRLVKDLSHILDSTPGRTIADIDPLKFIECMQQYTSNEDDWCEYAFKDLSRGYTRNLVDAGKGKSNLLILVWSPGKGSPIHDHADAHCVMKILKGTLKETRFAWPNANVEEPMTITSDTTLRMNDVRYMSDQLGLHRMLNPDPNELAISLHLYTPPNAAKHGCEMFDERTGRTSHAQQCQFYSEFGVRKQ